MFLYFCFYFNMMYVTYCGEDRTFHLPLQNYHIARLRCLLLFKIAIHLGCMRKNNIRCIGSSYDFFRLDYSLFYALLFRLSCSFFFFDFAHMHFMMIQTIMCVVFLTMNHMRIRTYSHMCSDYIPYGICVSVIEFLNIYPIDTMFFWQLHLNNERQNILGSTTTLDTEIHTLLCLLVPYVTFSVFVPHLCKWPHN